MKYKRLNKEELQALEKEFINFLAAAQITGADWEKMKKGNLDATEELLDTFSDMVYEKVLGNIHFLEYRDKKTLNLFKFENDKIILLGLRVKENNPIDLTQPDLLSKMMDENIGAVSIIKTERDYKNSKELEVFDLLQNGCVVTDDKLFNLIKRLA
jgi:hypothetical protein